MSSENFRFHLGRDITVVACIEGQDVFDQFLAHLREKEQQVPSWHLLPTLTKALYATRFLLAKTSISTTLWDKAVSRDYYIAANSDGGLYWIFETASMNTGIRKAYSPDSSWSGQPQRDNNNG